jgi:hypothetical protein
MSNFTSRAKLRSLSAGALLAVMLIEPAMGQEGTAVPNFSPNSRTGWIAGVPDGVSPVGQDFLQPPSGPGPVTFDKAHPYLDTAAARRANANTVHLSSLMAFLISIGGSGLFVRRRSGKLLILRLTPRELRRLRLQTTRSCRISSSTAL